MSVARHLRMTDADRLRKAEGQRRRRTAYRDANPREYSRRYREFHARLQRARGKASSYACVDCTGPAEQWSYDHTDPEPLTQVHNGVWVEYSTDMNRYSPRCRPCHTSFDRRAS